MRSSRTKADNARLDRLASEVKKGGGLALPSFFSAILNELLDKGATADERLQEIVAKVGSNKTKKLAETWQGSWAFLTSDLMNQLQSYGYVARNDDDRWVIGENFRPGVLLETIPARKGLNSDDWVEVLHREERENRNITSKHDHELEQWTRQPRSKPHDPEVVNAIRNSYEEQGALYPIIIDGKDRVIDGRTRHSIDPNWPTRKYRRADGTVIKTDDEYREAIREVALLNSGVSLDKSDVARMRRILGDIPRVNAIKRARVESALREDAARSNSRIAELENVAHPLVAAVRAELEKPEESSGLRIHCYRDAGGRGGGKTLHSADCWCGEGAAKPPQQQPKREPKQRKDSGKADDIARTLQEQLLTAASEASSDTPTDTADSHITDHQPPPEPPAQSSGTNNAEEDTSRRERIRELVALANQGRAKMQELASTYSQTGVEDEVESMHHMLAALTDWQWSAASFTVEPAGESR